MQAMVGFRNIAVHNYTAIDLSVIRYIIQDHLKDMLDFSKTIIDFK